MIFVRQDLRRRIDSRTKTRGLRVKRRAIFLEMLFGHEDLSLEGQYGSSLLSIPDSLGFFSELSKGESWEELRGVTAWTARLEAQFLEWRVSSVSGRVC